MMGMRYQKRCSKRSTKPVEAGENYGETGGGSAVQRQG
jgi:hypothetical protein